MQWWQWLVDIAGILLLLIVIYGVALVVRRRVLARKGALTQPPGRARLDLGVGRYSGETWSGSASSRCLRGPRCSAAVSWSTPAGGIPSAWSRTRSTPATSCPAAPRQGRSRRR